MNRKNIRTEKERWSHEIEEFMIEFRSFTAYPE
jgi:hypothetical protein